MWRKIKATAAMLLTLTAGGALAATIVGTEASDRLVGGDGSDDPGFDVGPRVRGLYGGLGDDAVHGGGDNLLLIGGAGADLLSGGPGDDQIGDPAPEPPPNPLRERQRLQAGHNDLVSSDCERLERI